MLTEGNYITTDDLQDKIKKVENENEKPDASSTLKLHISDYEKKLILQAYKVHSKDKEETAKALGIDLATLYRKFKKYGIEE